MKPLISIMKSALLAVAIMVGTISVSGGLWVAGTSSAQAAVVNRIDVRGNVRMEADTIASYLTIKPGQSFSNVDIDDSVKALFGTGLFSDVSIRQSGNVLIVDVTENATVSKVFFEGNNRLKDAALAAGVQTKPLTVYSEDVVLSDVQAIKQAYSKVGRDDTQVSYEVVPLANNRVNVVFRINESGKVSVGRIIFVGNEHISDYRLRDTIATKEKNLLSFLGTSDIYDPDRLKADEERLRQFYFNKGYADFQLVSTDAQLDSATNEYIITFTMEEGARYTYGTIAIESSIPGVESASLYPDVKTVSGDHYSARDVEKTVVSITQQVAEAGYAFVEVTPRGNRNFENNTIDITYYVDEGPRVYIEQINIVGNDKTREYVIRREFELSEGDAFNQVLVEKTKRDLMATGLFDNVIITNRPGSAPDKVVLVVHITEKATGEFSLGGGYSSTDGAVASVSFSEKNFMGRGQFLKISGSFGSDQREYGLSFTEPYFLGYNMSAGFDINHSSIDPDDNVSYSSDSTSARVRFGIPITDNLTSNVYYTYKDEDVDISDARKDRGKCGGAGQRDCPSGNFNMRHYDGIQGDTGEEISSAFANDEGSFTHSGLGLSLTYLDVDNASDPRDGFFANGYVEAYGVGGDANYVKAEGSLVGYKLLSEDFDLVGMARLRGGVLGNTGGEGDFRTTDNFFGSGRYVRGWDNRGFGARDPYTNDALGGQHYVAATAELQFPMPFIPESAGFRGALFADAGFMGDPGDRALDAVTSVGRRAFGGLSNDDYEQLHDTDWRASLGLSLIWASPFGPLRVDYAFPLNDKNYDDLREFSFGVSTKF